MPEDEHHDSPIGKDVFFFKSTASQYSHVSPNTGTPEDERCESPVVEGEHLNLNWPASQFISHMLPHNTGTPEDERRDSPIVEVALLLAEFMQHGLKTLAFWKVCLCNSDQIPPEFAVHGGLTCPAILSVLHFPTAQPG
mgnify:CR=1 FL=1